MPTKFNQRQLLIIFGGGALIILIVILFYFGLRPKASSTAGAITLSVWGTDSPKAFTDLASAYTTLRPGAKINYTQIDPSDYADTIIKAIAAGNGPDVFEINDHELPQWQALLTPMPSSSFASEFNLVELQNDFPTVVQNDFVSSNNLYGLPFSIDTLAMLYNKDLLDSAGIALPPATWDDFEADVLKLRLLNSQGQIQQAAAAIGGSSASIPDATDILSLLMLQNGTAMTNDSQSSATFAQGSDSSPGLAAFNFYLQFANAASPYYTWNDTMGDAEQSFIQGNTAILFGYYSTLKDIQSKAPFLSVGIAPVPQPKGATISINYPNYNGLVVAKGPQSVYGWDFVLYSTIYAQNESIYLADTGDPPALRSLIAQDESNPNLSVFALQSLTAQSWYEADDTTIDGIFDQAIVNVLGGTEDSSKALLQAQESVTQLMNQQQ